jgi:hypothetical protein
MADKKAGNTNTISSRRERCREALSKVDKKREKQMTKKTKLTEERKKRIEQMRANLQASRDNPEPDDGWFDSLPEYVPIPTADDEVVAVFFKKTPGKAAAKKKSSKVASKKKPSNTAGKKKPGKANG